METHARSLVKAVSYRCFSSLIVTSSIVYVFTGQWQLSLGIGVAELVVKVFTYFLHERVWTLIPYGRERHPLAMFELKKPLSEADEKVVREKLKDMGYLGENI
ncbi:MAG TPA: DUF2061 domain-containing protein [Verrucomicrobiae bacterium]|jgi:uncharacterized membrane protein